MITFSITFTIIMRILEKLVKIVEGYNYYVNQIYTKELYEIVYFEVDSVCLLLEKIKNRKDLLVRKDEIIDVIDKIVINYEVIVLFLLVLIKKVQMD